MSLNLTMTNQSRGAAITPHYRKYNVPVEDVEIIFTEVQDRGQWLLRFGHIHINHKCVAHGSKDFRNLVAGARHTQLQDREALHRQYRKVEERRDGEGVGVTEEVRVYNESYSEMANENLGLHNAKRNKRDEFYTQLVDIERELRHYRHHFRDKVVYCNCDDPFVSAFFEYFRKNYEYLGLKKIVTTCYKSQRIDLFSQNDAEKAIRLEYFGGAPDSLPTLDDIGVTMLDGDGDFRSQECIKILQEADIVVTNPPFSLFGEYVTQLAEYDKKFIIIGHQNAITYKSVFPLIKSNRIWLGYGFRRNMAHFVAPHYEDTASDADHREGMIRVSGVMWFTNLDHNKRHEEMILVRYYTGHESEYPKYDNYDAIEVSKTQDIPADYDGVMGVCTSSKIFGQLVAET